MVAVRGGGGEERGESGRKGRGRKRERRRERERRRKRGDRKRKKKEGKENIRGGITGGKVAI